MTDHGGTSRYAETNELDTLWKKLIYAKENNILWRGDLSEEDIENAKRGIFPKRHWWEGKNPIYAAILRCYRYKIWRQDVVIRDNFTCQDCGVYSRQIHAHHIIPATTIIRKLNIRTRKEILACTELWDIGNGVSLCNRCHHKRHSYKGQICSSEVSKESTR
jgi:hypothetical protein